MTSIFIRSGVSWMLTLLIVVSTIDDTPICFASPSSSIVSVGTSQYNIISRDGTRDLQVSDSPMLISFDGDLDAIKELALAKANRPPTSYACDSEVTKHLEIVNWMYSIETVPWANTDTVYGEVEEITLEQVAPRVLTCYNNQSSFANIVAMDITIPGHETSGTESCTPALNTTNKCTVVIGRMRMFLSSQDTIVDATALVLKHIEASYQDPNFVALVNSGLLQINFLAVDDTNDDNAPPIQEDDDGNTTDEVNRDSSSGLGVSSMVFVAIGSAALVVMVGSVYVWRRARQNGDDDDIHGSATRLASLTINDTATFERDEHDGNDKNRPASPYSEMVSGSYRLDRLGEMSILSSSNMSPVYELEGNETDNDTVVGATSVLISEGGYTTDACGTEEGDSTMFESTTVGGSKYSSSQSTSNVLGARPFPGMIGHIDMEEISDSDLDTSGEMSPVKMYIASTLLDNPNSSQNKLLVLPTGRDPMDDDNDDHDTSLLFGSPLPASLGSMSAVPTPKNNTTTMSTKPFDESSNSETPQSQSVDDVESLIGSMSLTSPMSQTTSLSLPEF